MCSSIPFSFFNFSLFTIAYCALRPSLLHYSEDQEDLGELHFGEHLHVLAKIEYRKENQVGEEQWYTSLTV